MNNQHVSPKSAFRAFSLVELVVVIAVIVVIATFTVPAATTILKGSQISQASQQIIGKLSMARQTALSKNRSVEVRFYRYGDPNVPGEDPKDPATGKFRAMQLFEVLENGATVPMGNVDRLPVNVVFSYESTNTQGLSSLLDKKRGDSVQRDPKKPGSDDPTAPRLPNGIDYNYQFVAFRFQQDGSTDLAPLGSWYVTLIGLNDRLAQPNKPPANFFTIQLDPVSGGTKIYRPSV